MSFVATGALTVDVRYTLTPEHELRIDDPDGCPAFFGRAINGVTNGASPEWMQRRLRAIGQRPISLRRFCVAAWILVSLPRRCSLRPGWAC